jgi:hypothetical protein
MKLNAPKKATWWIALIIAAVDLAAYCLVRFADMNIPILFEHRFLVMLIAFILLWLGTFIKGL